MQRRIIIHLHTCLLAIYFSSVRCGNVWIAYVGIICHKGLIATINTFKCLNCLGAGFVHWRIIIFRFICSSYFAWSSSYYLGYCYTRSGPANAVARRAKIAAITTFKCCLFDSLHLLIWSQIKTFCPINTSIEIKLNLNIQLLNVVPCTNARTSDSLN